MRLCLPVWKRHAAAVKMAETGLDLSDGGK